MVSVNPIISQPFKGSAATRENTGFYGPDIHAGKPLLFAPRNEDDKFMRQAIDISREAVEDNIGGPIGAVIVKDGKVIGRGYSPGPRVKDPTAHAEILAIRDAAKRLNTNNLTGTTLYTSLEPCPMCLAASYWAKISKICYVNTSDDVDHVFADKDIKQDMEKPPEQRSIEMVEMSHLKPEARQPLNDWMNKRKSKSKISLVA